ncbi:MAG TPA: hypothetical protein VJY12_05710 [Dysgonamonadaceae bacterium]|nr:hypothetical protein [Dysgonamonadaceae bacterium]
MYRMQKIEVKPYMKMVDLIEGNPSLLLFMQHFNIDLRISELTVSQLCKQYDISETLFISVANLYNGYKNKVQDPLTCDDILRIIEFLRNSHIYYRKYKYPEIRSYIHELQEQHASKELLLLEKFFNTYYEEVLEHLDYEDNVAFPYFTELVTYNNIPCNDKYSAMEYYEHHTDIELKLADLKKLLLKHIKIENSLNLRRRLLTSLLELEFDLYIHSLIEETILIPAGREFEKDCSCKWKK